jgi:glycosyltransferase involved in cell wall biosynthesis
VSFRGYVCGGAVYPTAGSQSSIESLKQLSRDLGLEGRVGFTGFIEDSPSLMRSLDLVVHASTRPEPFGLVITEAMASGRAVVVSAAGGAAEIASFCDSVATYEPGNVLALASLLETLARDDSRRKSAGEFGRRCAEKYFDQIRLGEQFGELYQTLISTRSPRMTVA